MNIHKILANAVVLAGFVAIPFIPFIVFSETTFFPFIVGKNFAFRIVVEVMFSAWLVLAYVDPAYRPKKSYLLGAFLAFASIITLSAIFGENPTKSFWSNFERMEGVITYLHLFVYFIVSSTVLTVRDLWRPYLNLHLAAGVIMAMYGVLQWAGDLTIVQDGARVNGTLGNAAYLGTYALFNIFIAGFFLVRESFTTAGERARVAIYGAIILLQIFVLYHTATRGAMLGLIGGAMLAAFLVAIFEQGRLFLRLSAVGILFAGVLGIGVFFGIRDTSAVRESPVLSRFASISLNEKTTRSRFMVWDMAWQGFKERPVLGWGMENFNYVFNKYYNPKMYDQEQWFDRAHNVFFDWLIAGGVFGLFGYLALFGCAVYCVWRRTHTLSVSEKAVITGLLGGYFFQNLFVFDNLTSLIYFATILGYIESVSQREVESRKSKVESNKNTTNKEDLTFMVSGGAFILALVLIYVVNYNGVMQNVTLFSALSERTSAGPMHNLDLFKKAIGYNSFGTSEAREQLTQVAMGGFDHSRGISEIQRAFLVTADEELQRQIRVTPNDARYHLFAGDFLARVGQFDMGIRLLQRAHELSPKKQTILFSLGIAYYNAKDFLDAEKTFKEAYELDTEFDGAKKYYAQMLIANKKIAEAKKLMGEQSLKLDNF